MLVKKININGKAVPFGVSARTPRLYRERFGKEVMYEMTSFFEKYQKALKENNTTNISDLDLTTQVSIINTELFENLAYIMAKQANPDIPDSVGEWLDEFGAFDVYEIAPKIMELWELNKKGISVPKKK